MLVRQVIYPLSSLLVSYDPVQIAKNFHVSKVTVRVT